MDIQIKWKTVADALKELGEKEAMSCLVTGFKQKQYRKAQNDKKQMIYELAKNDPRFKDMIEKEAARKVG